MAAVGLECAGFEQSNDAVNQHSEIVHYLVGHKCLNRSPGFSIGHSGRDCDSLQLPLSEGTVLVEVKETEQHLVLQIPVHLVSIRLQTSGLVHRAILSGQVQTPYK